MLESNKELDELKALYEELWHDGKRLVKDMKKSIEMYLFAGIVTLMVALFGLVAILPYISLVFQGNASIFGLSFVIIELVLMIVIAAFGVKLVGWYRRLRQRYAKLFDMERNWRKVDE